MNIRPCIEARVLAGKVNIKWIKDRQSAGNRCWTRHGPTVRSASAQAIKPKNAEANPQRPIHGTRPGNNCRTPPPVPSTH